MANRPVSFRLAAVVMALFVFAASARGRTKSWPKEPAGWRGVAFGTPKNEAIRKLALGRCADENGALACEGRYDLAPGLRLDAVVHFIDGRFHYVTAQFNARDWPTVRKQLLRRYGSPTTRIDDVFEMPDGRELPSEEMWWEGEAVYMTVIQREGDGEGGSITLGRRGPGAPRSDLRYE